MLNLLPFDNFEYGVLIFSMWSVVLLNKFNMNSCFFFLNISKPQSTIMTINSEIILICWTFQYEYNITRALDYLWWCVYTYHKNVSRVISCIFNYFGLRLNHTWAGCVYNCVYLSMIRQLPFWTAINFHTNLCKYYTNNIIHRYWSNIILSKNCFITIKKQKSPILSKFNK